MQVQITILGVKQFSGRVEGVDYDHTKLIIALPFPKNRSDSNIGLDAQEAVYGKSLNFKQFEGRTYPFKALADVELTTKGMEILQVELPQPQATPANKG